MYILYKIHTLFASVLPKKECIFMKKTRSRGNGEGTIFQRTIRGKKVWVSEYTLGIDETRKKKI